jgi:predicted DNA-binding transcriptional regulator AlpA
MTRLLKTRDVAEMITMSRRFVLDEHKRGRLRGIRLSTHQLRFREEDVRRWLDERSEG